MVLGLGWRTPWLLVSWLEVLQGLLGLLLGVLSQPLRQLLRGGDGCPTPGAGRLRGVCAGRARLNGCPTAGIDDRCVCVGRARLSRLDMGVPWVGEAATEVA